MKWKHKATIMKTMARLPLGEVIYKFGQKRFGRLNGDPMMRLPVQADLVQRVRSAGSTVVGKILLEVGSGHVPLAPIGFFLSGAEKIITVDLHRRIDWQMTRYALEWMAANRSVWERLYLGFCPETIFRDRVALLERCQRNPREFLKLANIEYLAPADAAFLDLPDASIDFHFSITTLEHIPEPVIAAIFEEAKRVLRPTGMALHLIDPSDHFQHMDRSISAINFLQYSDDEWADIGGNQFAYCNRMRASDYVALFTRQSWKIAHSTVVVDEGSVRALKGGFAVSERFRKYGIEDMATTELNVVLTR